MIATGGAFFVGDPAGLTPPPPSAEAAGRGEGTFVVKAQLLGAKLFSVPPFVLAESSDGRKSCCTSLRYPQGSEPFFTWDNPIKGYEELLTAIQGH